MSSIETEIKEKSIKEIILDPRNAKKQNERGSYMLARSVEKFGARGGKVLDRNGIAVTGNETTEKAHDMGFEDAVIIKGDPNKVYYIQYDDFDMLDPDNDASEFAVVDNRVGQFVEFEPEQMKALDDAGTDLGDWFLEKELESMFEQIDIDSGNGDEDYGLTDEEGERENKSDVVVLQLFYSPEDVEQFESLVKSIKSATGIETVSSCVLEALKIAESQTVH